VVRGYLVDFRSRSIFRLACDLIISFDRLLDDSGVFWNISKTQPKILYVD
jgi:hypothetical protein